MVLKNMRGGGAFSGIANVDGLCRVFETNQLASVNIYISWNGLRKPFVTIQMPQLKLFWIWIASGSTMQLIGRVAIYDFTTFIGDIIFCLP